MSAQYTPGPWHIPACNDTIFSSAGRIVAEMYPLEAGGMLGVQSDAEREANAALIADAPAMLEALLDIARQLAGSRFKLDVKRDYSLMVADATARKLLDKHGVQP